MLKLLVIVVLSFQLRLCSGQASPNVTLASALSQICAKTKTGSAETTTTTAAPPSASTEAPATEAPATEAPATEAPATEAPATEAPASSDAPAGNSDELECKVNTIVDYLLTLKIKDGNFRKYLKKDKNLKLCQVLTPKCQDMGIISQEVKNSFMNPMNTKVGKKPKASSSSINIKMSTTLWVVIVVYCVLKWQ